MPSTRCLLPALALLISLALPVLSQAQTDSEANAVLDFNFTNPGARSMAMGGAFLGSVDDATAAYANPAGLLQLSEPEVMVESRRWRRSVPYTYGGRANGDPTGFGVDTVRGLERRDAEASFDGISFAAATYPSGASTLAVYYQRVASFDIDFQTGGLFAEENGGLWRRLPVEASYSLDVSQLGLTYAREWDTVTAGLGVGLYRLELSSLTQRFDLASGFGSPSYDPSLASSYQSQFAEGTRAGLLFGFHWEPTDTVTVGMVLRSGPSFELELVSERGLAPGPVTSEEDADMGVFHLPDFLGIGVTYQPTPLLSLHADLHQIGYSAMMEDFQLFFPRSGGQRVSVEDFAQDDVVQLRLGAEYLWPRGPIPLAVRAGAWFDPDHRLRAEEGSVLNQATFFKGEGVVHWTAGLGLVFTSHLQVDVAVDVSEVSDEASLSFAYRF